MNERRFSEYKRTFFDIQKDVGKSNNVFSPQKVGKNVKILAGIDHENFAISVVTKERELKLISTELIKVRKIALQNNEMATLFILTDENLLSIFISFAIDIENVVDLDDNVTIVEIYNRYLYWQKMFNAEKKKFSESTIKGLICELHVIETLMIPKYGPDEAIRGWIGSESERKDFAYSDGIWYEAKAISFGKDTVRISSVEQLESNTEGILLVSELEKTSSENPHGVRLIDQINRIRNLIELEDVDLSFLNKISLLGFTLDIISNPEHEANHFRYIIHETYCYSIDDSFPRIKREELPIAAGQVSYELILAKIEDKIVSFK